MSTATVNVATKPEVTETRASLLELLKLSAAQKQALADKFNKLPKMAKREVRIVAPSFEDEVEMYSAYIITKTANDFIASKMRERWVSDLEIYIPRLNTKDVNLQKSTDEHIAKIAREIEDADLRAEVQTICKKNLLPKSTDMFNLMKCFERLEELFVNAWKA